ncbi:MAG: hypothetical protein ABI890_06360 [Lapillicoccus sp.]
MRLAAQWRRLGRLTRPVEQEAVEALRARWEALPAHVRTPSQTLGRHAVGCEGTHGVFPKCNLACTPCYHSRDANRVAVSGSHTQREVLAQLALLRDVRGPRAHAQLIGGEVSLLTPDDHAATLQIMRAHGREPMSMSHGDFDYDYLTALALGPGGTRRLDRLSFAGHFDSLMFGRRGIERPSGEVALNPYRERFVAMFARLRHEHGVTFFLAHTMTVTPRNVNQIAQVVRDTHRYGFGLFSFQPAAFVGDDRRWHEGYRETTADAVWAQVEAGAGTRLPFRALQVGDERCNRTTYGFYVGEDYFPILDDEDPADLMVRDAFFTYFGGISFSGTPLPLLLAKLARVIARHPRSVAPFAGWLIRTARTVGVRRLVRYHRIRPVTFVMHSFMDAADVAPAWRAMQDGQVSDDPRIIETQQRLAACSYAMAHPETGKLVPACVQHSVLDPGENATLRTLLPLTPVGQQRPPAGSDA